MHPFTLLFLLALAAVLVTRLWLAGRQIRAVRAQREHVPDAFSHDIPPDQHRLAADYAVERTRFGRVDAVIDALLLLIWTLGGGIASVDAAWRGLGLGPIGTGIGVILTVVAISAVIDLPLRAWRIFVIEGRFGFNRMTPGLFLADLLRMAALALLAGIPLLALVLWLMQTTGALWWLWVWGVWLLFNLAIIWAWPRFIAPLFNVFRPLADAGLRTRIDDLVQRCGFRSGGVFVVDGSRRSRHANAYFAGFGRNRRIVFHDTLLEQLSPDEIEAVLAHELGHFRHGHIRRMITVSAVVSLAGLAGLAWLMQQPWFYFALGVPIPSDYAALLLFLLITPLATHFLKPLFAGLSRHHEFEADAFAARQCSAEHLIAALVTLYRENAGTLTPDALHSAFHDSHPPAMQRIAHLQRCAQPPVEPG